MDASVLTFLVTRRAVLCTGFLAEVKTNSSSVTVGLARNVHSSLLAVTAIANAGMLTFQNCTARLLASITAFGKLITGLFNFMAAIKLLLNNLLARERRAFFPAHSGTEMATRQKFNALFLALECLHRGPTWYTLLMTTSWDDFFNFYRAPSTILTIMALPVASAFMLRAQFGRTVLLAFVQRMVSVIGMAYSFTHVTARKAKLAWQGATSFWCSLEVVCYFCMYYSFWVVTANQL